MASPFDQLRARPRSGGHGHASLRSFDPGPRIRQNERAQEREAARRAPQVFEALKRQAFEQGFTEESKVMAARQREADTLARESARAAEKQRVEQARAEKAAARQKVIEHNVAAEQKYAREKRSHRVYADGLIRPDQSDEEWEAQKAEKERVKSGMDSLRVLGETAKIARRQAQDMADNRTSEEARIERDVAVAEDAVKSHDAEMGRGVTVAEDVYAKALKQKDDALAAQRKFNIGAFEREAVEKNMRRSIDDEEARHAQAARELKAGKTVSWIEAMSGNRPKPEVSQRTSGATSNAAGTAPAPPAPKPVVESTDDELRQRLTDADSALPQRQQSLETRRQANDTSLATARQKLDEADQKRRTTPVTASGYSPHRLPDGSEVDHKAQEEYETARQAFNATVEQFNRENEGIGAESAELETQMGVRNEAATEINRRVTAKWNEMDAAQDAETDKLRTQAGFEPFVDRIKTLDKEFRETVRKMPDDAQRKAAAEVYQQRRQALVQEGAANKQAIESEFENLRQERAVRFEQMRLAGKFSGGSEMGGEQEEEAERGTLTFEVEKLAEQLGIEPKAAMGLYEDTEKLANPWTGLLNERPEQSRALSDGRVIVNPSLWADPEAYEKAVNESKGSDEGKKAALAMLPELRRKAAEDIAQSVSALPDFKAFLDAQPGTLEEKVTALMKEQKRGGALDQAINRMIGGGGSSIAQQAVGVLASLTGFIKDKTGVSLGSDYLHGAMQWWSDRGRAYETAAQLADTHPAISFGTEVLQGGTSLLPAALGGMTGKLLGGTEVAAVTGSALMAGGQSAGGTYAEAYGKTLKEALSRGETQEVAERTARTESLGPAVASGILTGVLTKGGGAKGVEAAFRDAAGREAMKRTIIAKLREVGVDVAEETLEEGLDQLGQGIIAKLSFDPNRSLNSIVDETVKAGLMGGILGGAVSTVKQVTAPSEDQQAMEGAAQKVASDAELAAMATPESQMAGVVREIAQGVPLEDLTKGQLESVGLKRTNTGEIKAGKDAMVSIENGLPIIRQEAIDLVRQQFPATGAMIGRDEVEARAKFKAPTETGAPTADNADGGDVEQQISQDAEATIAAQATPDTVPAVAASMEDSGAVEAEAGTEQQSGRTAEPQRPDVTGAGNADVTPASAAPSELGEHGSGGVEVQEYLREATERGYDANKIMQFMERDDPATKVAGAREQVARLNEVRAGALREMGRAELIPDYSPLTPDEIAELKTLIPSIAPTERAEKALATGDGWVYRKVLRKIDPVPSAASTAKADREPTNPEPAKAGTTSAEPPHIEAERLGKEWHAKKHGGAKSAAAEKDAKFVTLLGLALKRRQKVFPKVKFTSIPLNSPARIVTGGVLEIDLPKLAEHVGKHSMQSAKAMEEFVDAIVTEEAEHRVFVEKYDGDTEFRAKADEVWAKVPTALKKRKRGRLPCCPGRREVRE